VSVRLALVLALLFGVVVSYLTSLNEGRVRLVLAPGSGHDLPVMAVVAGAFVAGAAVVLGLWLVRDLNRAYREYQGVRRTRREAGLSEIYHRGVDAQLAGRGAAATQEYEEVLRREPGHPEAHARLGELALERGDPHAALTHHLEALRSDERPETLLAAAQAYRRAGRADDAIALYGRVLEGDPSHVTALRALRDMAVEAGRWPEALRAQERLGKLATAGERASESAWLAGIHYELGRRRQAEGNGAGAVAAFREALRAQSDFLPAMLALGDAHRLAGEPKEALRAWERGVEAQPALPLLARLEQVHRAEGRPTRMIALYREAVARQPDNVSLAFGLGRVYFDLSMLDEAADQFQKVEVRAPELPAVRAYLGAVFERRGQVREALEEYRQALRRGGGFEWPHRCGACGAAHAGWIDRCPSCGRWNTSRP
jgi:lipopolysaccharide biosynthesis regulator YciM